MAIYEKRGATLSRRERPIPQSPTPQDVQALVTAWLAQPMRCAQCGQWPQRLQGSQSGSMLVLVAWCAQHGPAG
jgi:hypothetical protein